VPLHDPAAKTTSDAHASRHGARPTRARTATSSSGARQLAGSVALRDLAAVQLLFGEHAEDEERERAP
jgi:hypothetical protein